MPLFAQGHWLLNLMQLNQFTDIGLRALIYLTQPARETPFTIKQMAAELSVSQNHLVKVIHFMGKQQWILTTRGKGGGIRLAKPLTDYLIGSVIQTLENHLLPTHQLVNCDDPVCSLKQFCKLNPLLAKALNHFYQYLNDYTLADIVHNPDKLKTLSQLVYIPIADIKK